MGQYLRFSEIKSLQIEPASKCNLLCPQCARVHRGRVNPIMPLAELQPEDYNKIFSADLAAQLKTIAFNGNYGDPIASRHLDYAIGKCLGSGMAISIATNGSLRSPAYWQSLGKQLSGTKSLVSFSIDGLADTNAIYRRGSSFEKIMENAAAYIQAGGRARWDFLVFDHNHHQIEEAKNLARRMGFAGFQKKFTARFAPGDGSKDPSSHTVFNTKGRPAGLLKKPPGARDQLRGVIKKHGSWQAYMEAAPIACKFQRRRALFIDFEALVWPCCWTGAPVYFVCRSHPQKKQLEALRKKYKKNFNSLRHFSLKEILSHRWLASDLAESWTNKTNDKKNPKLEACSRVCGPDYEFTSGPGSRNSQITSFAAGA